MKKRINKIRKNLSEIITNPYKRNLALAGGIGGLAITGFFDFKTDFTLGETTFDVAQEYMPQIENIRSPLIESGTHLYAYFSNMTTGIMITGYLANRYSNNS